MTKINFKVYAIVVVYNGTSWLEKCIASLRGSTIPLHIIAIDNNSSDGSADYLERHFPEIELIRSGKNLGFGGANNLGLRKAVVDNADFVFLLNQDAWIDKNTVEELLTVFQFNNEYGILSPFHLDYTGMKNELYFNDYVLKHYTVGYDKYKDRTQQRELLPCSFVHAACWLLPIDTIKQVGGFDPLFFHYGEDNDFVQRLRHKGLHIGIVINATVYHQGTNEGLVNPSKNIRFLTNQILLRIKHPEASHAGAFYLFCRQFLFSHFHKTSFEERESLKIILRKLITIFRSRVIQKNKEAYL